MPNIQRVAPHKTHKLPEPAPIVLTAKTVGKADQIVQAEVNAALELVAKYVKSSRTALEITVQPDSFRTRGGLGPMGPPPPIERGLHVNGDVASMQGNSGMDVTVRANSAGRIDGPFSFKIQMANDNMMAPGVRILSRQQIADAIINFMASSEKGMIAP